MNDFLDDALIQSLMDSQDNEKENAKAQDEQDDWMQLLDLKDIRLYENRDEEDRSGLNADEYHNEAVRFANRGDKYKAEEICLEGLRQFPYSVDLLSDIIEYSSDIGDLETAGRYYETLKAKVPVEQWNWRAFTFSANYFMKKDPVSSEAECRWIIAQHKKWLPYDEKASVSESRLEQALGHRDRAMEILQQALGTYPNACQCALLLADLQMDRGLYEAVLETANYGIAASAETQPSINVPYLCFLRTLAKDYLLHRKECERKPVHQEECIELEREYNVLLKGFPQLIPYRKTIKMRVHMLDLIHCVKTE